MGPDWGRIAGVALIIIIDVIIAALFLLNWDSWVGQPPCHTDMECEARYGAE